MANREKYIKKTRGPLTKKQRQFIEDNYDTLTAEQIAEKLDRTVDCIKKHIRQLPVIKKKESGTDVISQLHVASFWPDLKQCLIGTEVDFFENEWAKYCVQFGALEILATDEAAIRDLIMTDIHSIRCNKKLARTETEISLIEKDLFAEREKDFEDQDAGKIQDLNRRISELWSIQGSLYKESREYESVKEKKFRLLKAGRDQRFKKEEERNKSIVEMIKGLDEVNNRIREGRLAEKYKMSAEKIADEWNEIVPFEDEVRDKVLLSSEGEMKDIEQE